MPKISIMTMAFGPELARGELTDTAMLKQLEDMGFDGVELSAARLLEGPQIFDACQAYLAESTLEVSCLDVPCNFIAATQAERDAGVQALLKGIDAARILGAPIVLAAGSRLSGGFTPPEGRQMIADGLNACMDEAQKHGIVLAIEDYGVAPTLQCAADDCLEVLDKVRGLAFVFDTGNFYFRGEDPLANLDTLGPKTCHVHLKDWVKSATPQIADVSGAPLGTGLIPNEEIVDTFLNKAITQSFSIELGASVDKIEAAKNDLQTVRQWFEKLQWSC